MFQPNTDSILTLIPDITPIEDESIMARTMASKYQACSAQPYVRLSFSKDRLFVKCIAHPRSPGEAISANVYFSKVHPQGAAV